MSLAGDIENNIYNYGMKKPGIFWDKETKKKIKKGETYFIKAAHTLDGSSFAKSVREHLSDEAAVELKHIFDYIFNSSRKEIILPDYEDLNTLNEYEQKEWKLPNSKILVENKAIKIIRIFFTDFSRNSFYYSRFNTCYKISIICFWIIYEIIYCKICILSYRHYSFIQK